MIWCVRYIVAILTARRLLNLLTALSVLLCVVVCVLWLRSYWVWEQWVVSTPHRLYAIALRTGGVSIDAHWVKRPVRERWETHREGPFREQQPLITQPETTFNRLGFFYDRKVRGDHVMSGLTFPYWCVLVACALPALWLLADARRKHRSRANVCCACGYDLRATPGRCAECGTDAALPPVEKVVL